MAFSESTAVTSRTAFITALIGFAVTNAGFTNQGTTIDGAYTIHHISKGGIYWNFMEDTYYQIVTNNNIYIRMTFAKITTRAAFHDTGVTAGQYIHTSMTCFQSSGPYVKYFLYTDGTAVHCVLKIYTGVYSHMSFGNVIKFGTWTGGEYLTANNPNTYSAGEYIQWDYGKSGWVFDGGVHDYTSGAVYPTGYLRHVVGSASSDHYDFARIGNKEEGDQWCKMTVGRTKGHPHSLITDLVEICSPLSFNTRAPIFPTYVRVWEDATSRWTLAGHVPYARALNIKNIAAETIVEGDWIVFPLCQREGGNPVLAPTTDYWGVAYKRVA